MSTSRSGVIRLILFLGVFLASSHAALAATCNWTGLGNSTRWSNAQNWAACNGRAPVNGDNLSFQAGTAQRINENDIAGLRVGSMFVQDRGQGNDPFDLNGLGITVTTLVHAVRPAGFPGTGTILRLPIALNLSNGEILVQEAGMTLSITGRITGPLTGTLFFSGPGTLVLSNAQNMWQHVNIVDLTVRIGAAGAWPDEGVWVMNKGAAFVLNDIQETVGSLSGVSGTLNGPRIQLNGGATLTIQQRIDGNFQGTINGTGGLVKNGGATLTLAAPLGGDASNSFSGLTTVNAGALELFKDQGIGLTGPLAIKGGAVVRVRNNSQFNGDNDVTIDANGVLDLNGFRAAIGSLSGAGAVQLSFSELAIGANGRSTTFTGTITGVPRIAGVDALVKVGTGTLTLTGQSVLGGRLRIEAGRLVANGMLSSNDVQVNAGILSGIGTLSNPASKSGFSTVSVNGGRIAPGDALGTLRAMEAVFEGGFLDIRLDGVPPTTGYSQLELESAYQLSPTTRLTVNRGTFTPARGATFTIVRANTPFGPPTIAADNGTFQDLPEGATFLVDGQRFRITYRGGDGNDIVLTAEDDGPSTTYFLSEGATGDFFDEDVALANPHDTAAPVTLTFSKENGEQVVATRTVPARSRLTVRVDDIPSLENAAASLQVRSDRGLPLAVERSMFWDPRSYAGHTGGAVSRPSTNWFFAEGSQGFFQTFVLIINPATTPTDVTFTFLRENERSVVKTMRLGASSRLTLHAGDVPELVDRSFGIAISATQPIMAERAMYFGTTPGRLWSGGHESAGVTEPSSSWFLAEGATGGFFDTFILMSNPQPTPAKVTVRYLLDTGETVTVPKTILANARLTTNIEAEADARLRNAAVSTVVTSDVPIIVERSMYWPGAVRPWGEAHNSFGVVSAGTTWGLAEGRVGGALNFHTFVLLANPQANAADVRVTFLREKGEPIVQNYTVPPTSRFNIDTSGVPGLKDESFGALISVRNGVPIIVERSMYWDVNGIAFSGGTNATGITLPSNVP